MLLYYIFKAALVFDVLKICILISHNIRHPQVYTHIIYNRYTVLTFGDI